MDIAKAFGVTLGSSIVAAVVAGFLTLHYGWESWVPPFAMFMTLVVVGTIIRIVEDSP